MLMAVQPSTTHKLASEWHATLALQFARSESGTILARNAHRGPLRVQRPLYPEGPEVCHAVVLHPPSGIAAGDVLAIDVVADPGTHVLLTTPGATKWYRRAETRAPGMPGRQDIHVTARGNAIVEWLPQPNIVYEDADARATTRIDLDDEAVYIGIDIVVLGRRASGERFDHGAWRQRVEVRRNGRLVWLERAAYVGADDLMHSPVGLDGRSVMCTVVASGPSTVDDADLDRLRNAAPQAGVTCPDPTCCIARWCDDSSQDAWATALRLWSVLRAAVVRRDAVPPRLWST